MIDEKHPTILFTSEDSQLVNRSNTMLKLFFEVNGILIHLCIGGQVNAKHFLR